MVGAVSRHIWYSTEGYSIESSFTRGNRDSTRVTLGVDVDVVDTPSDNKTKLRVVDTSSPSRALLPKITSAHSEINLIISCASHLLGKFSTDQDRLAITVREPD